MKKQIQLLLYQSIEEHDFDLFTKIVGDRDLKWLNSVRFGDVFDISTPLEVAIEISNQPVVVKILEMGDTPSYLDVAIIAGDPNILKLLLTAGAGAGTDDNNELLFQAARCGNLEILKLLLEHGADFNSYDNDWIFRHPLVTSIANGHIHIYEYLINLAIEQKEILNIVALQQVAMQGNIKALEFLLDRGIDINSTHHLLEGSTALIAAVGSDRWNMVDYLISANANVDRQDSGGRTALMCAADRSSMTLSKKLLLAGASKYLKDNDGNTALDLAVDRQDKVLIKLLK